MHSATAGRIHRLSLSVEPYSIVQSDVMFGLDSRPLNAGCHELCAQERLTREYSVSEVELEIGKKRFRLGTLESMFIPRNIEHAWAAVSVPAKIINTYQPAGKIEEFFQVLPNLKTCRRESRRLRKATPPNR